MEVGRVGIECPKCSQVVGCCKAVSNQGRLCISCSKREDCSQEFATTKIEIIHHDCYGRDHKEGPTTAGGWGRDKRTKEERITTSGWSK